MPEAGMEKTMDEILEQVQREYADQAKQEAPEPVSVGAREAIHDTSNRSPEGLPTNLSPEGLPSWKKLTRHDIEQAKQLLTRKRKAALSRHAAELKELDTEQDEIENLERLIAAFSQKLRGAGQPAS